MEFGIPLRTALLLGLLFCAALTSAVAAGPPQKPEAARIWVAPQVLAEAENPTADLAASGGGWWNPGPERFHGWALRDLRDYLQRSTGRPHTLTGANGEAKEGIVAGTFEQFPAFRSTQRDASKLADSKDPEAFVIEAQGGRLYLLGKGQAGLIAAVYTLLDRLGFKWLAPGPEWENVPKLAGLPIDKKLNAISLGPSYQNRHFFPSYGPNTRLDDPDQRRRDYAVWNLRNRMGGSAYTSNAHNVEILPPDLYKSRPELYALVKGKRIPHEIARGNPEVVALAVENAVRYLKEHEGKGSFYNSYSLETGDGVPPDEESLAKIGNHMATDLNYWFANQVAAGIEKAGLKDKWVGTLSYSDHAGVPSFDLHPKVSVVVTSALDFSSGMTVEQRLDGLRQRKATRLGVYEYLNLITWSQDKPGALPAADPLAVAANLKRWHSHGARGYMAETSDSWINGGAGHYLATRLLWDISADPQKELDAYYQAAFGPAAAEARALYEDWTRYMGRGVMPRMARDRMAQWHAWINTAEKRVAGQSLYERRLTDLKRYYLYLNLWREYEIDLTGSGIPSKQDRFLRLLRFAAGGRGSGAFHAVGLFPTLLAAAPAAGLPVESLPAEYQALTRNINDAAALKSFATIPDADIRRQFDAARLPLDGSPATGGTLDPRLRFATVPPEASQVLRFPRLHGPPIETGPRHYLLHVVAATPKLSVRIVASNPLGGGTTDRTCVAMDSSGREMKRVKFSVGQPAEMELLNVKPGFYTLECPEFGAEELTVSGGNTYGAVRAFNDTWGFNAMRRSDQKAGDEVFSYFVIPPKWDSLKVRLTDGTVAIGIEGGALLAPEIKGTAGGVAKELRFEPSPQPRVAFVRWPMDSFCSTGFVIEGVTAYSPTQSAVGWERIEPAGEDKG